MPDSKPSKRIVKASKTNTFGPGEYDPKDGMGSLEESLQMLHKLQKQIEDRMQEQKQAEEAAKAKALAAEQAAALAQLAAILPTTNADGTTRKRTGPAPGTARGRREPTDQRPGPLPEQLAVAERPRVIITGRGQLAGRGPTLVRLRPDVVAEFKSLVDGPLYLSLEWAMRHISKELRARKLNDITMIRAEELG